MKTKLHKTLNYYDNLKSTNSFLYYLAHAPIFGHFFHEDLVSEYEAKEGINIAVNSLKYLYLLLKKIFYLIIFYVALQYYGASFSLLFILMTITGSVIRKINNFDEEDYDKVILLRVPSDSYVKHKINYYLFKEFILMSLAMLFIYAQLKINYLWLIYLVLVYLSIHLISEMIYICRLAKHGLNRKETINYIIALLFLAMTVFLWINETYISNVVIFLITIPIIFMGICSYYYLIKFPDYKKLHRQNLDWELINDIKLIRELTQPQVNRNVKNISEEIDLNVKQSDKAGYDYLYSMFLNRYNKSMSKGERLTNIVIILVGIIMFVLPFFSKGIKGINYVNGIFDSLYIIFFVMYLISTMSQNFIALCFFQIDRYLINYNFYRSEKAIDKNLRLRLKTIFQKRVVPTALISFFYALIFLVHGSKVGFAKFIIVTILPYVLSLFFSLYHVSAYYLLQPYAFDGTVVNKAYKTLDYFIYLIIYFIFYSEIEFNLLSLILISVVLFIISACLYVLVLKKGPKTFRVR